MRTHSALVVIAALVGGSLNCAAQTAEDITDHGVAVPVAALKGRTHAVDADGQRLALMWIGSPTDSILAVNVDSGEFRQIPVEPYAGGHVYVSWHSTRGLWYSHYNDYFYEFDPGTLSFSFAEEIPMPRKSSAMSIHEDSSGIIWAALFPNSDLISYNPDTRELVNHGSVNEETWGQYPTHLAVDDSGWVYTAIGTSRGQLVAFNPATGERHAYIAEDKRTPIALSSPHVFRGTDGKVYATLPDCDWGWHVLWEGQATPIDGQEPPVEPDPAASEYGRSRPERAWPDGSQIAPWPDMGMRLLPVKEADGSTRQIAFDYETDGATVAVMYAGPAGKIYGSSQHPSLMFIYEPDTGQMYYYPEKMIAFKSLRFQGNYVFGGHYSGGVFWLLDTTKPITLTPVSSISGRQLSVPQADDDAEDNPRQLGSFDPNVNVPRNAFAHPDGRHIMISGVPGYGHVGGGLIIYDLETEQLTELTHEDILPWYSTTAIAALPDGNLLCGTTRGGGHGTTPVHQQARIYILDWTSKKVAWDSGPLEGLVAIVALVEGSDGLYYGVASEPHSLVVFDAQRREIVHRANLSEYGRHLRNQALITGPDGMIYLALTKALLRITPGSFEVEVLATPPDGVTAGLAIVNDRLYFASGSRIMSVGL